MVFKTFLVGFFGGENKGETYQRVRRVVVASKVFSRLRQLQVAIWHTSVKTPTRGSGDRGKYG